MNKIHRKHTKLTRPIFGAYGRFEIALVGTTCSTIQSYAKDIIAELSDKYSIAYVDSDHSAFENPVESEFLHEGASAFLLDQQKSFEHKRNTGFTKWDMNISLSQEDLVLMNGNHHIGQNQLLFIDSNKAKSVLKRLDQLTNVLGLIQIEGELSQDVKERINADSIPVFELNEQNKIIKLIETTLIAKRPELKALVLAGGKSTRMGQDKAKLLYNQEQQLDRISDVLTNKINNVFVSVRSDQQYETHLPTITDKFVGMGPMGAILSAFQTDPNAAWLVVACDLPFVDESVLDELISQRSTKHISTAFLNEATGFAEPLVTIWEPKSYMRMLQFIGLGYSCPRKVLINSDTHLITPTDTSKLRNINTPEEYQDALKQIS